MWVLQMSGTVFAPITITLSARALNHIYYQIYTLNYYGPFHGSRLLSVASPLPSFACRSFLFYSRRPLLILKPNFYTTYIINNLS